MLNLKKLNIPHNPPIILVSVVHPNNDKYLECQREIISGYNNAVQIKLERTHYIYGDHHDVIIKYIKDLLTK